MRQRQVWPAIMIALLAGGALAATPEANFLRANTVVMDRMMAGMAAKPSGQVDSDFVNMMEPHHQGAIDMAELELRYGRNEQLRRIAQEIIVDQQQEITAMRLALGRPLPARAAAPTQGAEPPPSATTPAMNMRPDGLATPSQER